MSAHRILVNHGSPYPLGSTFDGRGVNFAVYSEHARGIELCLFEEEGHETRSPLPERTGSVWHGYLAGVGPGQRYGYRASGPYEPREGLRFNPNVVLLDPYALAVDGVERWEAGCFAYAVGDPEGDLRMLAEQAMGAPRAVVVDPRFEWGDDTPPRTPLHRSVIYEAHVRGLTRLHPGDPASRARDLLARWTDGAIKLHVAQVALRARARVPELFRLGDYEPIDAGAHVFAFSRSREASAPSSSCRDRS